ncbi:MAG: flagellar hook capping FlgD N-terminal domain-containing protein [Alphaproteobacteria bacterium]|nr:flagellar hook capping FlgD N-terminal domain-containing protein [Alphaproteobacteria bacterium]
MTAVGSTDNSSILNSYIASQKAAEKTASTTTSDSTSSLNADFNTFLQILTAQLSNQDPTSPMDASEFTSQLVQYSEVEQQMATNDKLDDVLSTLNSNGITPLLNYVGQYVESSTDGELVVQNGQALLAYTLPSEAQSVVISVQDSDGDVVAKIDGTTTSGMNRVAWDGTLDSGEAAEDGVYKFVMTAKNSNGDLLTTSDVRTIGQVTGIETDDDGVVHLMVGQKEIDDTDIKSIFAAVATS